MKFSLFQMKHPSRSRPRAQGQRLFQMEHRRHKQTLADLVKLAEHAQQGSTEPYTQIIAGEGPGATVAHVFPALSREQLRQAAEEAALTASPIPATPPRPTRPPPRRPVSPFSTRPNPASFPMP